MNIPLFNLPIPAGTRVLIPDAFARSEHTDRKGEVVGDATSKVVVWTYLVRFDEPVSLLSGKVVEEFSIPGCELRDANGELFLPNITNRSHAIQVPVGCLVAQQRVTQREAVEYIAEALQVGALRVSANIAHMRELKDLRVAEDGTLELVRE